jgi:tricorn protease
MSIESHTFLSNVNWYFRKAGIGPLVGTRTWGGLVGIGGYPQLMDGGSVAAPRWAIYGTRGEWEVENHGIAPDLEVELDPKLVRQGHDSQLEKAVEVTMEALKKNPPPAYKKPAYPNYHQHLPNSYQAAVGSRQSAVGSRQ